MFKFNDKKVALDKYYINRKNEAMIGAEIHERCFLTHDVSDVPDSLGEPFDTLEQCLEAIQEKVFLEG
jgi:hypothetical protein